MALRQIRIGSSANVIQYDDAVEDSAIETDQPIKAGTPIDANDVLRLEDILFFPISVANVDNPTELNTTVGSEGQLVLAYSSVPATGLNEYTLYAYDASGPAVSSPYIVDAAGVGDERWIAVAGKYRISTILNTLTTKNPPIDADKVVYRDSTALDVLVTSTWTQVKSFLKAYFDGLYGTLASSHTQGTDTTLGQQTEDLDMGVYAILSNGVTTFDYAAAIADDGIKILPTILANYAAKVEVIVSSAGVIDANATFMIDSTGTVTPQVDSGNVVYNVDTDAKLCIGTAAAQNPLTIKYRLGSAVAKIMINMKYVKA